VFMSKRGLTSLFFSSKGNNPISTSLKTKRQEPKQCPANPTRPQTQAQIKLTTNRRPPTRGNHEACDRLEKSTIKDRQPNHKEFCVLRVRPRRLKQPAPDAHFLRRRATNFILFCIKFRIIASLLSCKTSTGVERKLKI